jgi:hypothetical protein
MFSVLATQRFQLVHIDSLQGIANVYRVNPGSNSGGLSSVVLAVAGHLVIIIILGILHGPCTSTKMK